MRDDEETFECDGRCRAETEDALLITFEDGNEHWIPKSLIHDDSEVSKKGDEGIVVIPLWKAEKLELV